MFDQNYFELHRARHRELVRQVEIARMLKIEQKRRSSRLSIRLDIRAFVAQIGLDAWGLLTKALSSTRSLSYE